MDSALISATALQSLRAAGTPLQLCDCRFDLADPAAGARAHAARRLPGAIHVHLDRDLSAPVAVRAVGSGRHPLPERQAFAQRLAALGLRDDRLLVAYDDAGGIYAARLWWMLRWAGHAAAQVLDGGVAAWAGIGGDFDTGAPAAAGAVAGFALRPPLQATVDYATLRAGLGRPGRLIVDARAADRFHGRNETLDPVGGHIPGAVNRPFRDNLAADGVFKPLLQLRSEWQAVLAGLPPSALVQQCGSGVTACHNLLAMSAAGLSGSLLYPGSWSEWCAQPGAPIATD